MARRAAFDMLTEVERRGAFSNVAVDTVLSGADLSAADRGLATQITYGVLTWKRAIDSILEETVHGGLRSLDDPVHRVLAIGVYQLAWLDRVPDHAAVDETVALTQNVGASRAKGLVNAVLREVGQRRDDDSLQWWNPADRERKPARYLGERYSLPNWMANRLWQLESIDRAEALAEALTQRAPTMLRGLGGGDPETLEGAEPVASMPRAIRVPGFTDDVRAGLEDVDWIVQDLGAQAVVELADVQPGDRVLDGCAGRGGKTLAMADRVGASGEVVAVDPAGEKLESLADSAAKAGLRDRIRLWTGPLEALVEETEEASFDVVLIDAPCSGLGVLRRQPEIRWNRREADVTELVSLQRTLLEAGAGRVRPGGHLVYAVCTFLTEEGPKQVERFVEHYEAFDVEAPQGPEDIDWEPYLLEDGAVETDPLRHDADLFYAAKLCKTSTIDF
jgi:16S rRNA (cytosine967-C5)-methyltransferase